MKGVDEEMHVHHVALSAGGIGLGGGRPTVLSNKSGIHVVKGVGPDLTNSFTKSALHLTSKVKDG